jgi:enoyl-CoA hydratase/carnithine racemase
MSGRLVVERREEVALLTLSNPPKRNALDPPMLDALVAAVAALPRQGVRAAVLTADGATFSSGFDIARLPATGSPQEDNVLDRALTALEHGELPIVAALNGLCLGGGCELAAACDLRVAHAAVELGMPPVRLGVVYAATGLERFVALIGAAHTRELFLTARRVDAARALAWGLIDQLVPVAELLPRALELATEIASGAPLAVRGTRRALAEICHTLSPATRAELKRTERASWESRDAAEARRAFAEKRPPRFTGK